MSPEQSQLFERLTSEEKSKLLRDRDLQRIWSWAIQFDSNWCESLSEYAREGFYRPLIDFFQHPILRDAWIHNGFIKYFSCIAAYCMINTKLVHGFKVSLKGSLKPSLEVLPALVLLSPEMFWLLFLNNVHTLDTLQLVYSALPANRRDRMISIVVISPGTPPASPGFIVSQLICNLLVRYGTKRHHQWLKVMILPRLKNTMFDSSPLHLKAFEYWLQGIGRGFYDKRPESKIITVEEAEALLDESVMADGVDEDPFEEEEEDPFAEEDGGVPDAAAPPPAIHTPPSLLTEVKDGAAATASALEEAKEIAAEMVDHLHDMAAAAVEKEEEAKTAHEDAKSHLDEVLADGTASIEDVKEAEAKVEVTGVLLEHAETKADSAVAALEGAETTLEEIEAKKDEADKKADETAALIAVGVGAIVDSKEAFTEEKIEEKFAIDEKEDEETPTTGPSVPPPPPPPPAHDPYPVLDITELEEEVLPEPWILPVTVPRPPEVDPAAGSVLGDGAALIHEEYEEFGGDDGPALVEVKEEEEEEEEEPAPEAKVPASDKASSDAMSATLVIPNLSSLTPFDAELTKNLPPDIVRWFNVGSREVYQSVIDGVKDDFVARPLVTMLRDSMGLIAPFQTKRFQERKYAVVSMFNTMTDALYKWSLDEARKAYNGIRSVLASKGDD